MPQFPGIHPEDLLETPWFVDYFHMGRFGERWIIVNALWYSKPKPPVAQ